MSQRVLVLIIVMLVGCMPGRSALPTPFPTATTVRSVPVTLVPTVGRLASNVGTATATQPMNTPTQVQPTVETCTPESPRTRHRVVADVDYLAREILVQQEIRYTNHTGQTLDVLVLNVEPNRWLEAFTLDALTTDPARDPGFYLLTGRRLEVMLPKPLLPDCTQLLNLTFHLTVPPVIGGIEAFRGYFGYTPRQINLGHWLPTVVPFKDGVWLFRDSILIGEQLVLDAADWTVAFNVTNAQGAVTIAAPGTMTQLRDNSWQFVHQNGREFAASLSPVFRLSERVTPEGVQVNVYTMPDALILDQETNNWIDGGDYAAQITAESVALYAEKYGPYPHQRMVIVQGDFPDGMEFSGFAFVSTDWFKGYDGNPAGYLMLITVHEVAHQWWYDQVGSDQALSPWLDEALSTYSEYVYIEQYYPALIEWWWYFRINRLQPQGFVDSTVYEFDQIRPYINAVYLRGVLMLHDIRGVLGDDAFFEWLARYAETNKGVIASADDLWASLTPAQYEDTKLVRSAFMRQPGMR